MEKAKDRLVVLQSLIGVGIVVILMWIAVVYAGPREDIRICKSYTDKYPGRVFNQDTIDFCEKMGVNIQ